MVLNPAAPGSCVVWAVPVAKARYLIPISETSAAMIFLEPTASRRRVSLYPVAALLCANEVPGGWFDRELISKMKMYDSLRVWSIDPPSGWPERCTERRTQPGYHRPRRPDQPHL